MDADNEAKGNDDNFYKLDKSSLVKDTYYAQLDSGGIKYHYQWLTKIHTTEVDGVRVIDEKKRWSWECRRHEFVAPGTYDINRPLEDFTNSNTLKREWKKFSLKDTWTPEKEDLYGGYIISGRKGFRSTNRFTYIEDMASFMMDLKDDSENARLVFYLAQSLRDASYPKLAVKIYKKRAKMDNGYWEENYESLIWLGKYYFEKSTSLRNQVKGSLNEITKSKEKYSSLTDETRKSLEKELSAVGNNIPYSDAKLDKAMKYLTTALSYSPKRWEAPCYILKIFDLRKQYQGGWIFGRSYMDSPAPSSGLFLNTNIINYDFHLQLSLIAFYAGEVKAFKELTHKILQNPDAPNHIKELCRKNLQFAK
jgi:tetratricopeptide (TPR) repeat protein